MTWIKEKKYLLLIILGGLLFIISGIYIQDKWRTANKKQNEKSNLMSTEYSFKIGGNANDYLQGGWYAPEIGFIWATEDAEIMVPIEKICDYEMEIKYSFHTLSERTFVYVNDIPLTMLNPDENKLSVRIPKDVLNKGDNQRIAFKTTGACSPYSLGESGDARVLGVAVYALDIFPAKQQNGDGLYSQMGIVYLFTSGILVIMFLLFKKNEKKQNFWRSFAMTIVTYECYLCLLAGLMTIIHIPVDVFSISTVNIVFSVCLILRLVKTRSFQQYYVRIDDSLFVILLMIVVIGVFFHRFTIDFKIWFETSDPGVHLKMAKDFVNTKAVNNMYIGQLLNGLLIESLMGVFNGALVYKSFIIQCGINYFVAGITFWAVVRKSQQGMVMRVVTYIVTLVYIFGYPYNDFLYGFVYLQMTITVICYLIGLMQDYMDRQANIWMYSVLIGAGCLCVGIGYTLFAPPIYLSILALIAYRAYQESWLMADCKIAISRKFVLYGLSTFLIPTVMTVWFIVIQPKINSGVLPDIGNSLRIEGGIYRNLYSDFLLYIFPAVCGIVYGIKEKKVNLISFLCPICGVYYFFFMYQMLSDKVSTYYFYKFNYLIWMIIMVAFVMGIEELFRREKVLFVIFLSGIALLAYINATDFENYYQEKNSYYVGYTSSNVFFRIFEYNKNFVDSGMEIPKELVEISNVVLNMKQDESVIFIGHWMHLYWYEALTDQRLGNIPHESYENVIMDFQYGKYGDYAVVRKSDIGYFETYRQYILDHVVCESDYAYIIKK